MKIHANSYYTLNKIPTYVGIDGEEYNIRKLIDERGKYKIEKKSLLKKLERKLKLEKINEKNSI